MTYAAQGVSVRVGSNTLLDDVSVEVRPGEIVAVAGPNGAGKTTLVSVLAGDRQPTAGSVTLDGRSIDAWSRGDLAQRRAVMAVAAEVAFDFDVEEVALLGRLPVRGGDPSPADRAVVRDLLEAADCLHLADRRFASLSSGERQRVSLARAIAQVSSVTADGGAGDGTGGRYLLLDEPTANLDPSHQHVAMRLLRELAQAGCGVLVVLHDLDLAAAYADRLVLMARGRVVGAGAVAEILRADVLEEVFDMPMLVMPHPHQPRLVVIADPPFRAADSLRYRVERERE